MLWGDLMIMFNQGDTADFWDTQQNWKLISWKLHSSSGVHTIMTSAGLVFHMLVENRYPLTKEVLSQMLELKLETEEESSMALELIKFVKQQLEEFEDSNDDDLVTSDHGEEERVKGTSNPLMAVMVYAKNQLVAKELTLPELMLTCKETIKSIYISMNHLSQELTTPGMMRIKLITLRLEYKNVKNSRTMPLTLKVYKDQECKGYLRKGQKQSQKRQNRARERKEREEKSKSEPKVKKSKSTPTKVKVKDGAKTEEKVNGPTPRLLKGQDMHSISSHNKSTRNTNEDNFTAYIKKEDKEDRINWERRTRSRIV
ncbi:hypothetical protein Tco_0490206 [Tanacetum coccineum]